MFLWTRRIHFCQPHWKKNWEKSKNFVGLVPEKDKKKLKTFFQEFIIFIIFKSFL